MKRSAFLLFFILLNLLITRSGEAQEYLDFIFADLKIDNRLVSGEVELITRDYENFYLSLQSFNEHLACELILDMNSGLLTGKFWDEEVNKTLSPELFMLEEDEPFVSIRLLAVLSIEYEFNHAKQWLRIITNDMHPRTKELIAQERKKLIAAIKERKASLLVKENEYRAFTAPNMDVNLALKHQKDAGYYAYAQLTQDLLYHQADIQMSQSDNNELTGEAVFSRKLHMHRVPMSYKFGDVRASQATLSQNVSKGVGLYFGQDERRSQKLQENVSGYIIPGTEVSLFQNDYLLDFVVARDDGFYEFKGLNFRDHRAVYRIRFNYPDGRVEERAISKPSWQGLREGQWTPEFLYVDSSESLLKTYGAKNERKFAMANATYIYSKSTLLRGGLEWSDSEQQSNLIPFTDIEWRDDTGSLFTSKLGYSDQLIYEGQLNINSNNHAVYLQNSKRDMEDSIVRSRSVGYIYTGEVFKFDSRYYDASSSGFNAQEQGVEFKLGYSAKGHSHYISWNNQVSGFSADKVSFVSSYNSSWGALNLSLSREFYERKADQFMLSYNKYWQGYNFSTSVRYAPERKDTTTKFRLSKSLESVSLSFSLSNSTAGESVATLNFSFSFHGKAPLKTLSSSSYRRGSVVKNWAFLDSNYNGMWDGELSEPILNGVKLKASQQRPKEFVSEEQSHMVGVDVYDPTIFHVDAESLDNPFLIPVFPTVQLESHPGGVIDVALPFQQVFEAEGEVIKFNAQGKQERNSGFVPLEILTLEGEQSSLREYSTEHDGFFIIDRLQKGQYLLTVPEQYLRDHNLECENCQQVIDTQMADDYIFFLEPIKLIPKAIASKESL
ncbi:hypothetical protein [Pseudoalteromonas byunsanensis]|uniref:Uncharacterized protein n=1 Tax=Pseudoalteromonas byunsanensis TaxID=327939 RepID=A0A1S1N8P4_9GAMM|nr:hypothetical protein [Pseudoalteromonas byunsanensis]OHU95723.1 hypothetical protein BIW53_07765 [Pseudoalteromonas byunsanensis]